MLNKVKQFPTMGDELDRKYGKPGTPERPQFDEKARAWCKCMNAMQ